MISQRISKLRSLMEAHHLDYYVIPSEDFHQSEYVGEYFKARAFISGFTGSAGSVIVGKTEAFLWTDGRYFLQADKELDKSVINLMKIGEPGVPSQEEYLAEKLPSGGKFGFDGRVVSVADGKAFEAIAESKNAEIVYNMDLIGEIWEDRPPLSTKGAFFLEEKYSGKSSESKIAEIREVMAKKGANMHIISSLDDVAWMLNIRGDDVMYSPLVLSYSIVTDKKVILFIDENKLNEEIKKSFEGLNLEIMPYNSIYEFVKKLDKEVVLLDPSKMNYALYKSIPVHVSTVEERNPSVVFKACKNDVEIENFRKAHIKDAIAHCKFMYWLKNNIGKVEITEISASDKLEEFRKEQEGYLWPSFAPISGYAANGAIVHYSASEESNTKLEAKGLYLSDTGGNYYEGSTDITRTYALGKLTDEEKFNFTLVLKSHISLANAKFLYGTSGYALDILTRKPFWDLGLNYNHGTGHGIGYLLNVHEGPAGFRYKINPARDESYPLQKNMAITIEPGIYIAEKHGVRHENVVIVKEHQTTEYGVFMCFEPITLVPFDLDAIDASMLSEEEKTYLNEYHKTVFNTISPHLDEKEREWLKKYTDTVQ